MKAKKSLGQHFLKSEKALGQIVEAANIASTDFVLEIGPGTGILTERLLAKAERVLAIEKDRDMIAILEERFANEIEMGKLVIIEGDILKFDPSTLPIGYKLVANIPYYITGAIIEQFLSTENQPQSMVLLMQKEVADRIVARQPSHGGGGQARGGKQSVLSIAVNAYGKPKVIAKVPPGAFNPPPKVDSAILYIEGISRDFFNHTSEKLFFEVMKAIFGKKRKQVGGSLADFLDDKDRALAILSAASLDPKIRPEELSLAQWGRLTQLVEESVQR